MCHMASLVPRFRRDEYEKGLLCPRETPDSRSFPPGVQMVWESGCVVVVMLTPLSENGVKQCHPYWPDEGSDVYHVYEVRSPERSGRSCAAVGSCPSLRR